MEKAAKKAHQVVKDAKTSQEKAAHVAVIEELFNDYYKHRHEVYKINFVRGLFFGLGSVLGGTVILALLIWVLSLFVDFPLIGELLKDAQRALEETRRQ